MPEMNQEPLSRLECNALIEIVGTQPPPPLVPPKWDFGDFAIGGLMSYHGDHTWSLTGTGTCRDWEWWGAWPIERQRNVHVLIYVALRWNVDIIALSGFIQIPNGTNVESSEHSRGLPGCEQGTPWGMDLQGIPAFTGYNHLFIQPRRCVSPLAPLLPMFVSSPTVHGVLGHHCVYRGPLYPEGAIYGETPPNGYGTRMRLRAEHLITTDPKLAARQATFAAAGEQWSALTTGQQSDWNAAAQTLKPRTTGYALWTRILATRRTDQIPTLEARIGKTLTPPTFPT